eukprot:g3335.t1
MDKFKYVVGLLFLIPLSFCVFQLGPRSASIRHILNILIGSAVCILSFHEQYLHMVFMSLLAYITLCLLPRKLSCIFVSCIVMFYCVGMHVHAYFTSYRSWKLDITGPVMILTIKLWSLSWSLCDAKFPESLKKAGDTLGKKGVIQLQEYAVDEIPSLLEYFGYVFYFPSILAGPFIEFAHYKRWAENLPPKKNGGEKKPTMSETLSGSFEMFVMGLLSALALQFIVPKIPTSFITDSTFFQNPEKSPLGVLVAKCGTFWVEKWELMPPFFHQMLYIWISVSFIRSQYYFAWKMAESACIASGAAYSGRNEEGIVQWSNALACKVRKVEFGGSMHSTMTYWNMGTAHWLRYYVYCRLPKNVKTVGTYMLSAFWHGLYPGYYLTFVTGAMFTSVHRGLRKLFFKRFGDYIWYHFAGFVITSSSLAYAAVPFLVLNLKESVKVWKTLGFFYHILAIGFLLFYGKFGPKAEKRKKQ